MLCCAVRAFCNRHPHRKGRDEVSCRSKKSTVRPSPAREALGIEHPLSCHDHAEGILYQPFKLLRRIDNFFTGAATEYVTDARAH